MDPALGRRFNGSGGWQIMHSDAYSRFYPRDVLDEMLDAAEVYRRDSLFAAVVELLERKQPDESIESAFLERFRAPLAALPAHSTVSFEGSKIIGLPIRYARDLRVRGVRTMVRWHEAVPEPDQILSFRWGRQMVESLGCVDTVLLHTDTYRRRLETSFERSGLSHKPETRTYRLGIDFEKFQRESGRLSLSNVHRELADFESLTVRQKNLLLESLATRVSVPNRWVIADTLDPIKGSLQAYEAISEFLRSETSRLGPAGIQRQHRFFIVQSPRFLSDTHDPFNMNVAYQKAALAARQDLEQSFPGIVFSCECFRGNHYPALTAVYEHSTALSGGVNEGLNLVIPESLYVNYLLNNSINHGIIGSGAGFAMQCMERGAGEDGFFPAAGDVREFVKSMQDLVMLRERNPHELRQRLERLVTREILNRTERLMSAPE